MRRVYIIWLVILFTSACKNREYLLIEAVKGRVISSSDKKPIAGVRIYLDKSAFNAFDTLRTDNHGSFFVDKLTVSDYKDMRQA